MNSTKDKLTDTLLNGPLHELIRQANAIRRQYAGDDLHLCAIVNAKSGLCGEDCKFCAQSARHNTGVQVYGLMDCDQIVQAADDARKIGAVRFGIVTSGNKLTCDEIDRLVKTISRIKTEVPIGICGSLGALDESDLSRLKQAGLSRYHHNIETSRRFYPHIVSTHLFDERLDTIRAAKRAGLEVCSGGIIGMGETRADRIDMAYTLSELNVDSVPLNILVPIPGTAIVGVDPLTIEEIIRTICIFRIILKDKAIEVAAGRELCLKDRQIEAFLAGANGMIVGGYLTVKGADPLAERKLIDEIKTAWSNLKNS